MPRLLLHRRTADQISAETRLQDLRQEAAPGLPAEVDQDLGEERVPAVQVPVPLSELNIVIIKCHVLRLPLQVHHHRRPEGREVHAAAALHRRHLHGEPRTHSRHRVRHPDDRNQRQASQAADLGHGNPG